MRIRPIRKRSNATAGARRPLVLAAFLTLLLSGCWHVNPRHGLILRGDWSFEVNRIPWMASHNDCYQPPFPGPGGAPGSAPQCGPQGGDATSSNAPGCGGGCRPDGCKLCPHGGGGAAQGDACVDYGNHPRFHPVPTKPVFSPRAPGLGAVPTSPSENRRPGPGRFHDAAIAEPEVIPAPKPKPLEGASDKGAAPAEPKTTPAEPKRLAKPTSQSAWIFTPPQEPDPEAELATKRTTAARSALR